MKNLKPEERHHTETPSSFSKKAPPLPKKQEGHAIMETRKKRLVAQACISIPKREQIFQRNPRVSRQRGSEKMARIGGNMGRPLYINPKTGIFSKETPVPCDKGDSTKNLFTYRHYLKSQTGNFFQNKPRYLTTRGSEKPKFYGSNVKHVWNALFLRSFSKTNGIIPENNFHGGSHIKNSRRLILSASNNHNNCFMANLLSPNSYLSRFISKNF